VRAKPAPSRHQPTLERTAQAFGRCNGWLAGIDPHGLMSPGAGINVRDQDAFVFLDDCINDKQLGTSLQGLVIHVEGYLHALLELDSEG
jgi:hypothetical protein